jgi:hypothetical protein
MATPGGWRGPLRPFWGPLWRYSGGYVADECAICQWIVAYRRRDLSPMERRALVDAETDHRTRIHPGRIGR